MSDTEKVRITTTTPNDQTEALLKHEDAALTLNNGRVSVHPPEGRLTGALIFTVLAACAASFQFGYHIGNVNAPGQIITNWYVTSHKHLFNVTLTKKQADFAWSMSVGIFAVGGMIGGLLSGWLADRFGRKGALMFNNIFAFIAAIFIALAKYVNVYYLVIIGRFIIGFHCGLSSGLVPMYLTEISPVNLRGMLGSVHQLMVTISILVAQIVGLPYLLGNDQYWPYIFALTIVPAVFQLCTLPFCPESPKYNLIVKKREEQAERDLMKLRGQSDVKVELDALREEAAIANSQPKVSMMDMFRGSLRWPLFIAVMMMLSQQLSGINVAMFYSTVIFRGAGLTGLAPIYATIGMGTVNVLQTIVSLWLVDHPKFGRRSLHIIGLAGMLISSLLLVAALTVQESGKMDKTATANQYQWASYLAIFFVLTFVISFATGPGSIPWFYVSEIFSSAARGNANSISVMTNWLANFFVGVSFLPINNILHQYTFIIFAAFLAFFIFFTWKFVPETKGKSVEQITDEFKKTR